MKTLYKLNKNGSHQQWTIHTEGPNIITEYGQIDGQLQTTSKLATSKNIGKSNEINPTDQAKLEAQSMWKKKLDSGYAQTLSEANNPPILPMLAKSYKDHADTIDWTQQHYINPKYDGTRSIARWVDNEVKLFSRKNKEWTNLGHIAKALESILPKDFIFDGEIYLHKLTFQEISSLTKKHRTIETQNLGNVNTNDLQYYVYDGFYKDKETQAYHIRLAHIQTHINSKHNKIICAPSHKVTNQEAIDKLNTKYVKAGYEGVIFRIGNAPYTIGHRSSSLLKIKTFMDAEFKITGYYEGIGRFKGAVTWICTTNTGQEFHCAPKGTMAQKQYYFTNGHKYIGKLLKVKFFEYTDEGLPRFPVGLGIRLDEDM